METISILFAPFALFDDEFVKTAKRSLSWAFKHGERVFIFSCKENPLELFEGATVIFDDFWDAQKIAFEISQACKKSGATTAIFSWIDLPFLNDSLTQELLCTHAECAAEYTFADGYPYGLSPEIIDGGAAAILSEIAREKNIPATRSALMSIMKGDINSFEIETVLSGTDFRQLRLSFCLSEPGSKIACHRLAPLLSGNEDAETISKIASSTPLVLRTIPYCVDVQIFPKGHHKTIYCPEKYGVDFSDFSAMSVLDFEKILDSVLSVNPLATISPSLFGEPLLHPDFLKIAESVVSRGFHLVIETDGIEVTTDLAQKLSSLPNAKEKIDFIVHLDAFTKEMYSLVRGGTSVDFEKAVQAVKILSDFFPERVYPQFVRMNENESELESFYRFWHEKSNPSLGNVIIRKFDSLCALIQDKKPADLSPLVRFPCWHQRRDMAILADGSVPLCRSAVRSRILGNALSEGVCEVWNAGNEAFVEHCKAKKSEDFSGINGACGGCDEFYTFSF